MRKRKTGRGSRRRREEEERREEEVGVGGSRRK
jgi:hypothetical protein